MKPTLYLMAACILFYFGRYSAVIQPLPTNASDTLFFSSQLNDSNLLGALHAFEVKCPQIVLKQALLESGHFTSRLAKESCNIFGLYNSGTNKYYYFSHWIEAVLAYKKLVQSKYSSGDYYEFLEALPYSMDENYTNKLKQL